MWNNFDKHVFAIFWMLDISDLNVPEEMYESLIKKKHQEIEQLKSSLMTQDQYQKAQRGEDAQ